VDLNFCFCFVQLSDLSLLELRHEVEPGSPSVVEVMPYDKDSEVGHVIPSPGEFLFVVRGLSLGDASLSFVTGRKSYQVRSETLNIQVRFVCRNVGFSLLTKFEKLNFPVCSINSDFFLKVKGSDK